MRHKNVFGINVIPISQKNLSFKTEVFASFSSIHLFYILKRSFEIGALKMHYLSKQFCLFTPRNFLGDLRSLRRKASILLILRKLIQIVISLKFLTYIHICQKSLIIRWMTRLWKFFMFKLQKTIFIVNNSFWLRNQQFSSQRNNIGTLHLVLKIPLLQKVRKISILKSNLQLMINQVNWKTCLVSVHK